MIQCQSWNKRIDRTPCFILSLGDKYLHYLYRHGTRIAPADVIYSSQLRVPMPHSRRLLLSTLSHSSRLAAVGKAVLTRTCHPMRTDARSDHNQRHDYDHTMSTAAAAATIPPKPGKRRLRVLLTGFGVSNYPPFPRISSIIELDRPV